MAVASKLAQAKLLFDFAKAACVDGWAAIDDKVMGGVSRSRLTYEACSDGSGYAVVEGTVSLERNGVSDAPVFDGNAPPQWLCMLLNCVRGPSYVSNIMHAATGRSCARLHEGVPTLWLCILN